MATVPSTRPDLLDLRLESRQRDHHYVPRINDGGLIYMSPLHRLQNTKCGALLLTTKQICAEGRPIYAQNIAMYCIFVGDSPLKTLADRIPTFIRMNSRYLRICKVSRAFKYVIVVSPQTVCDFFSKLRMPHFGSFTREEHQHHALPENRGKDAGVLNWVFDPGSDQPRMIHQAVKNEMHEQVKIPYLKVFMEIVAGVEYPDRTDLVPWTHLPQVVYLILLTNGKLIRRVVHGNVIDDKTTRDTPLGRTKLLQEQNLDIGFTKNGVDVASSA